MEHVHPFAKRPTRVVQGTFKSCMSFMTVRITRLSEDKN